LVGISGCKNNVPYDFKGIFVAFCLLISKSFGLKVFMLSRDDFDFFLNRSFGRRESFLNQLRKLRCYFLRVCFGSSAGRVVFNSIPKAGTHLLKTVVLDSNILIDTGIFLADIHHGRVVKSFLNYKNKLNFVCGRGYVGAHMPYTDVNNIILAEYDFKHVLLVRHPADVLVSQYFHCMQRPTNRAHGVISSCNGPLDAFSKLIEGFEIPSLTGESIPSVPPFLDYYLSYERWADTGVMVVRYEDLLGSSRGGDDEVQINTIQSLMSYIGGVEVSRKVAKIIAANAVGKGTNTMRVGRAGHWRSEFGDEVQNLIDGAVSGLGKKIGY
jgi:hypothetical protein